jgi:hypothetical protein
VCVEITLQGENTDLHRTPLTTEDTVGQ